jgi:phage-related tail fiber protein
LQAFEDTVGQKSGIASLDGNGQVPTTQLPSVETQLGFTPYDATNPAGYISTNQQIIVSGDATGSGTTTLPLTLAASGVTAGTYTKVTVDAKGRVTTGAALASTDVVTALGYTPATASATTQAEADAQTGITNAAAAQTKCLWISSSSNVHC